MSERESSFSKIFVGVATAVLTAASLAWLELDRTTTAMPHNPQTVLQSNLQPGQEPAKAESAAAPIQISGTWYDSEKQAVNIQQNGSAIFFTMKGSSDGMPVEFSGKGELSGTLAKLYLNGKVYNIPFVEMPAELVYISPSQLRFTFKDGDVGLSGDLYR